MPDWQPWRLVLYLSLELGSTSSTHFSRMSLRSHFERHMVTYHHEMMVLSVQPTDYLLSAWDTSDVCHVASGSSWGSPRGPHHENNCPPRGFGVGSCIGSCLFCQARSHPKSVTICGSACLTGYELSSGDIRREQTPCFLIKAINAVGLLEKNLELLLCHQKKN